MSNFQCSTNMHAVFSGLQQILGIGWQGSWDPLGPELGPIWIPDPAWRTSLLPPVLHFFWSAQKFVP